MKVCIIGTGYVGLVSSCCFADLGNDVIGVDIDDEKVAKLREGISPIYEPGISDLLKRNLKQGNLNFTTNIKEGIESSDIIFSAVGTPMGQDHRADLSAVMAVAKAIGKYINGYKIVVNKSTVPVGTAEKVEAEIKAAMVENNLSFNFDVVSNPEFLREGAAISDFKNPDRVVVGAKSERARKLISKLYSGIVRTNRPLVFTDVKSAEMIKYAANAMLATRISFMNMLSHLCEKAGGDIKEVAKGIGLDSRIGPKFLQAGLGYGGSCFPKDVNAIMMTLKDYDCDASILEAVESINQSQRLHVYDKVKASLKDLNGKTIGILGVAFKPKTDDIREAPALTLVRKLESEGARVKAFDPEARETTEKYYPNLQFVDTPYAAAKNVDCLVVCTEWDTFRTLNLEQIKEGMKSPVVVDGRNIYDPEEMQKLGFHYSCIGRK